MFDIYFNLLIVFCASTNNDSDNYFVNKTEYNGTSLVHF